jgi:hypothetical protein
MATEACNDPKTKKPLHSFHVHEFNPVFKAHAKMYLYVCIHCFLLYVVSMYREKKKREKILQSLEKSPAGH